MNVIFLGAPSCGKGTQAKIISKGFKVRHVSTGDLLREKVENPSDPLGLKIKETINKDSTKHTWATIPNDATCSTKGNHKVYCTSCGEIAEEYEIEKDPTNHKNTTTTISAKEATCTEPGRTANVYCNDCHTTITASTEIPATGHKLVHHAAKAATCTEDGNVEYWTCSTCNEMLLTNNAFSNEYVASAKINALGHNFAEEVMSQIKG